MAIYLLIQENTDWEAGAEGPIAVTVADAPEDALAQVMDKVDFGVYESKMTDQEKLASLIYHVLAVEPAQELQDAAFEFADDISDYAYSLVEIRTDENNYEAKVYHGNVSADAVDFIVPEVEE